MTALKRNVQLVIRYDGKEKKNLNWPKFKFEPGSLMSKQRINSRVN